jgi:hypothetical protein
VRIRNDSDSRALFPIKQVTILPEVNVAGADTIFTYQLFPKEQVAPTRGNERSQGGPWALADRSSPILTVPQEWRRAMSARLKAPHYALSPPFFGPCSASVFESVAHITWQTRRKPNIRLLRQESSLRPKLVLSMRQGTAKSWIAILASSTFVAWESPVGIPG